MVEGIDDGLAFQLLGVTGSGKTYTIANVIAAVQKPTLVMAPNKTLAAQLYGEFKRVLPAQRGRVFRQLLRLLPARGLRALERHLHREGLVRSTSTSSRCGCRRPRRCSNAGTAIIVATVSAIYGLGDPNEYHSMVLHLRRGERIDQRELIRRLTEMQYARNETELRRGTYRVRGDVIDVFPAEIGNATRCASSCSMAKSRTSRCSIR